MRSPFGNPIATAIEIGGHFRPGKDKIVRRMFGPVAKVLWPVNTDAHVAAIIKCDPRTARRYIAGEFPVPYVAIRAVNDLMLGIEN